MLSHKYTERHWIGAIALVSALIYLPILGYEFIDWDDYTFIVENSLVRNCDILGMFRAPSGGMYGPLTLLSFALQAQLTGLNAGAFHAVDLLLHIANTVLVYRLFRLAPGADGQVALLAALLFGIHPLHIESVAWATERKDTLSTLFFLLAFLAYHRQRLVATWILFIASLMSKSMTVTFPVLLLLWDWWQGRPLSRKSIVTKIPLFLASVVFGIINIYAQAAPQIIAQASQSVGTLAWGGVRSLLWYGSMLMAPNGLSLLYDEPLFAHLGITCLAYGLIIAAISFVVLRDTNGDDRRKLIFGFVWFGVSIALVLRLVPFGDATSPVSDRFVYLPSIGAVYAFATVIASVGRAIPQILPLFLIWIGILMGIAVSHVGTWKNSVTLWGNVAQRYPLLALPYNNMGLYYVTHDAPEKGIVYLQKSLQLERNESKKINAAANLAIAYSMTGKSEKAVALYQSLIEMLPNEVAYKINLAIEYDQMGNIGEAQTLIGAALALDPTNSRAHIVLGDLLAHQGMIAQAREAYARAIGYDSMLGVAHLRMALLELQANNLEKARQHARDAQRSGEVLPPELATLIR